MLLRFGVSNFRSIRDYAELSLIASDAIKDRGPDLLEWPVGKVRVLPGIVLYGANAAGKTSVYAAMGAMRGHVLNSFSKLGVTDDIPRRPFALDRISDQEPTRFDCDFILDEIRYHYGFEFNNKRFSREWLYSFPEGHKRILFSRDAETGTIEFGKHLKGRNRSIEELTRPNSLFLSAAAQSAHPQLTPIYSFFRYQIQGLSAAVNSRAMQTRIGKRNDPRLIPFLQLADTGIKNVIFKEVKSDARSREIQNDLRESLLVDAVEEAETTFQDSKSEIEVSFSHTGLEGHLFELPFAKESRGTRRISDLVVAAFAMLDLGGTLFIDELDSSLHTLLSLKLLSLFMHKATNRYGAQVVATAHDTNILCSGLLRRDQIWFAEKGHAGSTHLYPLTDISTRNTDNLEKGYLQGRFGAVPYLGRVEDLFEASNGET